jgi:hypothetical protein
VPTENIPESQGLKKIQSALPQYEIYEWRHAASILTTDFKKEWEDIREVLARFKLLKSEVVSDRIRSAIGHANKEAQLTRMKAEETPKGSDQSRLWR